MNRRNWLPTPPVLFVLAVLVMTALSVSVILAAGQRRVHFPSTLTVRELVVVDSKGVARAVIGSAPGGLFGLRLRDGKGRERMHLMLMPDEPFGPFMRFSAAENQKSGLFTGAPSISLYSQKGDPHVSLTLTGASEMPSLELRQGGQKSQTLGGSAILLIDPKGGADLALMSSGTGAASINVISGLPTDVNPPPSRGTSARLVAHPKLARLSLSGPEGEYRAIQSKGNSAQAR